MAEKIVSLSGDPTRGLQYAVTDTGEVYVLKTSKTGNPYRQRITSAPKIKRMVKLAAKAVAQGVQ